MANKKELFAEATLLMMASAYKTSKVYSVLPTDGTGDFTFARSTTSTRNKRGASTETSVAENVPALHYGSLGADTCPSFKVEDDATFTLTDVVTNSILTGTTGTVYLEGKIPDDVVGFFKLQIDNDDIVRTSSRGFQVKQGGTQVTNDAAIFTSDGTHIVTPIAVSWSGAGTGTPTILTSQNGSTKTNSLTDWNDSTLFTKIVIDGKSTDDSDRIKVVAAWDRALTQTELNAITG